MTRLLPDTEFSGFYNHVKEPDPNADTADLIECWKEDQEQMLEDLTHEQLLHLLFLSLDNKPSTLAIQDMAYEFITRKPSGI